MSESSQELLIPVSLLSNEVVHFLRELYILSSFSIKEMDRFSFITILMAQYPTVNIFPTHCNKAIITSKLSKVFRTEL